MIYEYRVYVATPGRMPDVNKRFREQTMRMFAKHKFRVVGFFEPAGNVPTWNAFVRRSRRFLESRYELVEEEYPGVQVWKRRGAA